MLSGDANLLLLAHHVAVELLIARVPSEFERDCPFSTGSAHKKRDTHSETQIRKE